MGFFKNVVTFGAAGRIEKKVDEFGDIEYEYKSLYQEMEQKRENVNNTLEKVVKLKIQSVKSLNKMSKISKLIKGKDREVLYRQLGNDFESIDFDYIDETINAGQIAMNATKGISTGIGTAAGAWALVSTFGTASTGTAIASLSGAAATNATLAWLGGGAAAAGGGGMAVGSVALGGIVAIPALAIMGIGSHVQANKKIKEIEKQMNQIIKAIDQIKGNLLEFELIDKRSEELIVALEKAKTVFNHEFKKTYKEIYRIPILSRTIKWIRKNIFRKNYFTKKDVDRVAYIGGIANDFAVLIDTKVFD